MEEVIEKKVAIDALNEYFVRIGKLKRRGLNKGEKAINLDIVGVINSLPPVQPERKRGRWIVTSEFEDCRYVKCNQCKVTQVFYYNKPLTNFCPNCGADMRGEQDE